MITPPLTQGGAAASVKTPAGLRTGSFCSGIAAPEIAATGLGRGRRRFNPRWFSEIEPFPSAVLATRFPSVPNLGDMTKLKGPDLEPVDLIVAGTPCQSFSVAGLRKGMADPRGNLALVLLGLVDSIRPRWLVWENVPGVLSSNGGRDFGSFLGALGQLGYGWAYRVLDAQYIGVPQRRRRVFVVGYLGNWQRAAAVLFERHSLSGNPPPRREPRQGAAGRIARSLAIRGRDGGSSAELGDELANAILTPNGGRAGVGVGAVLIESSTGETAHCHNAGGMGRQDFETETLIAHTLKGEGFDASEDGTGRGVPLVIAPIAFAQNQRDEIRTLNVAGALSAEPGMKQQTYLAYTIHGTNKTANVATETEICTALRTRAPGQAENSSTTVAVSYRTSGNSGVMAQGDKTACLNTATDPTQNIIQDAYGVRRLTPLECERLQGFPDNYTRVAWSGWRDMDETETPNSCRELGMEIRQAKKSGKWRVKDVDGPRYKALGNSMAVPVMRWIQERILAVDSAHPHP